MKTNVELMFIIFDLSLALERKVQLFPLFGGPAENILFLRNFHLKYADNMQPCVSVLKSSSSLVLDL